MAVGPDRQLFRLRAAEAWLLAGEPARSNRQLGQVETSQLGRSELSRHALLNAELALLDADAQRTEFYLNAAIDGLAASESARFQRASERLVRLQTDPASFAMSTVSAALNSMGPYSAVAGVALLQLMEDIPSGPLEQMGHDQPGSAGLRHWPELALSIRRMLVHGQDSLKSARTWSDAHPGHEVDESAYLQLADAYRSLFTLPQNIAVLLPFEGGLAAAGNAIRDGIVSAFMSDPGNARLRFYATGDEPESAVSAYFSAMADGTEWIIGPLRRESVSALTSLGALGVPALMLNNAEDAQYSASNRGLVFQVSLSQELEAQAVAEAALARNWQSALVLTVDNAWGKRVKQAFETSFREAGGAIAANAEFSTLESDHSVLLKSMLRIEDSERRKDRLQATLGINLTFEPSRRDDFDFIFLAAEPNQGRQIRPQLRFHDAGTKPVLAMGRIFSGKPDRSADQDLNGIIFPTTNWLLEQSSESGPEFASLRGGSMGSLFALGADAWTMMRWLPLMQKDKDLYFPGLAGNFSLNPYGRLVRDPAWAIFSRGQPVALTDAFSTD